MTDLADDDLEGLDPEFDDRRLTPGRALVIGLLIASFFPWVWRFSPWAERTPFDQFDDPAYSAAAEELCASAMSAIDEVPSAAVATDTGERATQVRTVNGILEALVDDLEAAATGTERDLRMIDAWVDDWRIYLGNRADYAERIATDPDAQFYVSANADGDRVDKHLTYLANTNEMYSCVAPGDVG